MKYLKIKICNQKYIHNIQAQNSKITSGRKNYDKQYERILKNILLTIKYKRNCKLDINNFFKKNKFKKEGNIIKIAL